MTNSALTEKAKRFSARKSLGQNFLVNKEALSKIADQLELQPGDKVLEIGPGLGFLTEHLLMRGAKVAAIEIDQICADTLQKLSHSNLKIITEDFLKTDLNEIISKDTKVIGNIPYNITTPIIVKLLGEIGMPAPWLSKITTLVLTVQKEVAERLVARPGTKSFGQITLLMNYFGSTESVLNLSAKDFQPVPQVDSAVIKFKPYLTPPIYCQNVILLRKVIQIGFGRRRKMLKNNLMSLHLSEAQINQIFSELNFDPETRAENLSLQQFAKLSDAINKAD